MKSYIQPYKHRIVPVLSFDFAEDLKIIIGKGLILKQADFYSLEENRMEYLWDQSVQRPSFPALREDTETEVLVIGGGMAGVLCAYRLEQAGVPYLLAEAKEIGGGVTKGTTAVLTAQHDALYTDLIAKFGVQKAKQYLDANLWAVRKFQELAKVYPCDFEIEPSFMYTRADPGKLKQEVRTVNRLGYPAEFQEKTRLPFPVSGAVCYPDMGQFHPLKFLYGIAKGLNIYENTFVSRLKGGFAETPNGTIRAKKIIVATHFPFLNRRGLYPAKLYQMRSFVVALAGAPDLHGTYVDTAQGGIYFRNYKNLLLVGGGDHRTGSKGGGFPAVHRFVRQYFPHAEEKYVWATQDCMSLDGIPYIGQYSPATPDLLVTTGFNEWGMTSSMVAAAVLTDRILGNPSRFADVFSPQRTMLRKQLWVNFGTTIADMALPVTKRCSHLGCALKWNRAEHTWDCPCHGSRFDYHGRLIDNPAMRDSKVE